MNKDSGQGKSSGGAERRRYVRLPIKLDAQVAIDGRPPIPCSVRDFCVAGIFIAIPPQQLRLVKTQTTATLDFALIVDGVQNDYRLLLMIFRIVGGGFGCGFENADPRTISLLQSLATDSHKRSVPDTPEALARAQAKFSSRFKDLSEPLAAIVSTSTERISREFLRKVNEALFLAARDAGNNVDEARYLDGQNEMRERADQIMTDVPALLRKGIAILGNPLGQLDEASEAEALAELSLIDKDEFEEFLTVSHLISELEPRFKDPLYDLERRFSVLANREVDDRSNPIGPAVFCGAYAEVLKSLQSDRMAINVIYRTLRQVLEPNLDRLYTKVNELLVEHGVLPVVEKDAPKFKRSPSAEAIPPATPDSRESQAINDGASSIPPLPSALAPQLPQHYTHPGQQPAYPQGLPPQPFVQAAPGAQPVAGGPSNGPIPPPAPIGHGATIAPPGSFAPGPIPSGIPIVSPPGQVGAVQAGQVGAVPPSGYPVIAGAPSSVQGGVMPGGVGLEATFGGFGGAPSDLCGPVATASL